MARAAAKRRPPVRHDQNRRRHKDSGGQRFEDTLFFNRLRKQAKWVFVFLAVVFAGGFVLFGVGSSNLSGLSDIFNGIRGGGSGSSVKNELKKTQQNPRDAQAWRNLAAAYDSRGNIQAAIGAWQTYTALRPKDVDGLNNLSVDLTTRATQQSRAVQEAQSAAPSSTTFGPPANSPLGRALASTPDPISQALTSSASQRAGQLESELTQTLQALEATYRRIAAMEPTDPSDQINLGDAAVNAGDYATAIAAYKKFLKLAPEDNSAPYVKQRLKSLQSQLAGAPQG